MVGRLDLAQRRHARDVGHDARLAQVAKLGQQRQWIGAVLEGVGRQIEPDAPGRLDGGGGDGRIPVRFAHSPFQVGQQDIARRAVITRRILHQAAHMIPRRQNGRDQVGRGRHLALADAVEGGLAVVGETGQGVEAEHGPRSLQGVKPPENGVHQIAILGSVQQIEQALLDQLQVLSRLNLENGDGFVAHRPSTFLATRTS